MEKVDLWRWPHVEELDLIVIVVVIVIYTCLKD